MALAQDCAQHVSAFVFGSVAVACGVAGAGVPALLGGAALITTGMAAAHEKNQKQGAESKRVLKRIIGQVTGAWRDDMPGRSHEARGDISNASDALIEFLPQCEMSRDRLVACATDASALRFPQAATALVMEELADKAPASFGEGSPAIARDFAKAVISVAFQTAIDDRAYFEKLEPHLLFEIARTQGLAIGMLSQIISTLDKISEEVAHEVVDEWERRGHHTAALKPDTIIALARKIPDGGQDLDTLVKDLITALDAAEDLIAQGTHKTNLDQFAEAVFARVAERTAANDFDGAADAARAGFEDWKKREAERAEASKQTGLAILDTQIKAETSRSNAAGVAMAEIDQLRLQHSEDLHKQTRKRQDAYYVEGRDKGQRFPLLVSIEIATLALETAQNSDARGAILIDLGVSLQTLGQRERSTERLEKAITAYRAALDEYTRDRASLLWAGTQMNLGNTLQILGERVSDTKLLQDSVAAHRAALKEWTRDRAPLQWAMTQMNLGTALRSLGVRESGTARLEEAVTAHRAAVEERTRERVPLEWATTQMNLGAALTSLGERESGTARLEEAVTAYHNALEEVTREHAPLGWARTQNNLGTALTSLGERESGTARLEEAVTAYRLALQEWTRDRVPLDWATTQNNLGNALSIIGERESGTARLEDAVTAYHNALEERTCESVPLKWAETQNNLGSVFATLGQRGDDDSLLQAIACYRRALLERREDNAPYYHQQTADNLNLALALAEERGLDIPDETVPD